MQRAEHSFLSIKAAKKNAFLAPIQRKKFMKSLNQVLLLTVFCTVLLTACNKADNPNPTPAMAGNTAANVSDADVTAHVQKVLNNEPGLAVLDITVLTTKGDVRLTGVVSSQTQIDTAIRVARAAEGAHSIHNELTLKP
jgi:osmotically-inducible protein OsmY